MLSKFSVKKPFTVFVGIILILILGVVSFTKMTTDLLPSIDLPYVIVMTTYPGASPEKVEMAVTKPLEQVLATTTGIKNINSISSENSSVIMLEFEQGINMDSIIIEMNSYIDLVKSQLDDTVGSPMITKLNPDMLPVMVASVDIDGMDVKEASKFVNEKIIQEFERIEGVASVSGTGLVEEKIKVELNQDKIDEINNKVLASVDEGLAEGKNKLDQAKNQLASGKEELSSQGQAQAAQLADAEVALQEGKKHLQDALSTLTSTEAELQTKKLDLEEKKSLLEKFIKGQEDLGIPVLEKEKELLAQMVEGLNAINAGLTEIANQKPVIEANLSALLPKEKELELGKFTLNQELSKAQASLLDSEVELNKATEEFEKARDEAYAKANMGEALNSSMISNILMAENFSMPAGYIKEGEESYLVKVGDNIKTIEEIENQLLFNIDVEGVGKIYLKDIATIAYTDNSDEMYAKINGNDGIILSFQKQSTYSTAEVSKKINKTIKTLQEENEGMHITSLQDQGVYIDMVISSVLSNLVYGGILAIAILFIFLKSIKSTITIALSIPISVLFALVMMYFSGVTMNIISMSGLALGVGMLVDNSIVVIENIYRLRSQGMSKAESAVKGASQVAGAIFASTLTTVCVFLPIVFTEGISRQLFTDMGLTIAYSLLASLIIALTFVPAVSATVLSESKEREHKWFDKFVTQYEKALRFSLKHKAIFIIGTVILLISSAYITFQRGASLIPDMDGTQISITMEMDKDATTNDLREMSNKLIEIITPIEDVETVGAMQASGGISMMGGGSSKSISLYVILKEDKKLKSVEVSDIIEEKTKDLDCKLSISASNMDMSALGGSGVNVVIKGNDLDKLKEVAKDIGEIVEGIEGTKEVNNGLQDTSSTTNITVDKNKAMEYGLTVAQVYQAIAGELSSETTSTTVTIDSNDYPIIVAKDEEKALNRDNIKELKIKGSKDGQDIEVAISEIASIKEEASLDSISRSNQVRDISVTAAIDSNHNIGKVSDELEAKLKEYDTPKGFTIEIGGEKESIDTAFNDLFMMIALAIVFIYLIMVAQFQSLLSPFIVLFTIPLAFTGGFLALLITGFDLSMISILGFLILTGIVVNNGIVFVDYVNNLREEGVEKSEALVSAGKTRIRPILMTALTTILGLSTMSFGMGMGADMAQAMAVVTIGGLTYATVLTLFIVPIIYSLLHKRERSAGAEVKSH